MKANKTDRIERQGVGLAMTAFEKIDFAFREQHESDYGVDAHIELIENEKPTGQLLGVQLKTGQSYLSEKIENGFVFRADRKHVEYWLNHSLPIIITLCDPEKSKLYWQHISRDNALQTGIGERHRGQVFILDSKGGILDHPSHFDPRRNCLLVIAFAMIPTLTLTNGSSGRGEVVAKI